MRGRGLRAQQRGRAQPRLAPASTHTNSRCARPAHQLGCRVREERPLDERKERLHLDLVARQRHLPQIGPVLRTAAHTSLLRAPTKGRVGSARCVGALRTPYATSTDCLVLSRRGARLLACSGLSHGGLAGEAADCQRRDACPYCAQHATAPRARRPPRRTTARRAGPRAQPPTAPRASKPRRGAASPRGRAAPRSPAPPTPERRAAGHPAPPGGLPSRRPTP